MYLRPANIFIIHIRESFMNIVLPWGSSWKLYEYSAYMRSFHGWGLREKFEFKRVLDYKNCPSWVSMMNWFHIDLSKWKKKTLSSIDV